MRKVCIYDGNGSFIADAILLERFIERLKGLMLVEEGRVQSPVILHPCSSVHTLFVRFPLDVFFVSRNGIVVERHIGLAPWRIVPPVKEAAYVVEAPSGIWRDLYESDFLVVPELVEGWCGKRVS